MLIQILIIFGVLIISLIFVFRLVFRRDLDEAVGRLKHLQEEAMLKESHLREELERAKLERASQVSKGKKEAQSLIEQAKKEVEAMHSRLKERAEQERAEILEAGGEEVEKLKKEFANQVSAEAVKFAVDIIQKTFTEKGKEHLQHELFEEFLKDLEKIGKEKFSVNSDKGVLSSSFPLTGDEKRRLERVLADKIGARIEWEEKVDATLITGLVIRVGDFVVDGSLKNKLQKVIPLIQR